MVDLELSEVIFSIQNDLYNSGTRDHFLQILSLYVVYSTPSLIRTEVFRLRKKSVPISEFIRISELIHLYGEFCSESL